MSIAAFFNKREPELSGDQIERDEFGRFRRKKRVLEASGHVAEALRMSELDAREAQKKGKAVLRELLGDLMPRK